MCVWFLLLQFRMRLSEARRFCVRRRQHTHTSLTNVQNLQQNIFWSVDPVLWAPVRPNTPNLPKSASDDDDDDDRQNSWQTFVDVRFRIVIQPMAAAKRQNACRFGDVCLLARFRQSEAINSNGQCLSVRVIALIGRRKHITPVLREYCASCPSEAVLTASLSC